MQKNIFLSILFCIGCISYANGQWIQDLEIRPETPSTADSIYLIATVDTPSSSCALTQSVINVENNVIGINACYANGVLAAICRTVDTIPLGKIEEVGAYELLFMASLIGDFNDTTCTSPSSSMMSSFNFTVDLANPVSEINPVTDFTIFPNPSKGIIELFLNNEKILNGQIQWFDQYGKKVHGLQIDHANHSFQTQVDLSHLPNGLYYCVLTTDDHIMVTKRMMLMK